ncbi:uncharacterized protein LOC116337203 isoform X2 [Contarinia nasturtii]|uniref:uncharacterized protein LOC116337203 isoform X2 n=1 Tax=Contarinia nasturtii TaxID=265458 RepID=UPI0012D49B83|nr:uncharacterized protein LOC116337203 isoform X2 [Contarinia nasturtii]
MEVAVRLNMPSALDSDDKDVVPGTPENHIAQHIVDDNIIAETSCASDTDGSNHTEPSLFSDEEGFLQSIFDYESLNHHENDIIPDSDPSENEDESEVELPSYDDFRRTLVHSDGIENVYVPEIEAIPESNYLENVIILETDSSESSEDEQHEDIDDEHQEEAASHLSDHSNDSLSDENQSNYSSNNEIIMETDLSESDDDSFQSNANIPLQNELDLVPETDFIENSEPEDEDDEIVSESSYTSEEEIVPNHASDDLLSQALQLPNAPNIFTEISENLHYNEVALENNELNNGEIPIGLISPNLFDDEVPTELGLTSPEHLPNVMPVSDEETQEIPPTPFAYELVFPNFEPEQRAILPQENENGEQRMAAPVIEEENPLDSDDDETILTMADAESSAIIERIENFIAVVMNNISNGCRIQVLVQNRSNWDNCYIENERFVLLPITNARCRRIRSAFNLSLIFYLLSEIHELLLSNRRCTVRELYYKNVLLTQKQQNVNEALKVVCCLLDATPWQLGVLSTSKGLIAGRLVIHLQDDSIIDCSMDRNGITLPHLTAGIVDLRTTAQHILLVEKDTVFKSLLQNNILERWNYTCILITGKGYPDMNTRLILSKLRELHSLPIDIVTDADPYGAEIMLTYRHGSLSMSNLAEELAVPSVRWLGIFPSDIRKFGIRAIPLTQEDKRKLDNILNRPFINDHVHRELLIMKQINLKAEIEGISEASATYLIDVYLRNKLDNNDRI